MGVLTVGTAFSDAVTSPGWRAEATAWITDVLARRGVRTVAPPEQPRVRPWSTQLVVATDAGRFWFKATCRSASFEPALQALLAEIAPDAADAPAAVDADRGWMLTADRGATLRERRDPDAGDWGALLTRYARLQQTLLGRGEALRATGLPDCSPGTVPARLDAVLDRLDGFPTGHPARPDDRTADRLRDAREAVAAAATTLAQGPLPSSLQHGDLHPGNVFEVDGDLRVFDLGDAQWAHPLEVLEVSSAVARHGGTDWEPVERAYRRAWDDWSAERGLPPVGASPGAPTWDDLRRAAGVTHAVNRAWTWCGALAEATEAEWADWGEAPGRHLAGVLGLVPGPQT
ncbi:phosphotransferase [Isoptericola sp. NPDC057391]|uniref:phosphotransferase n=1 Tax=Isoptericola sp. NPDC057391 TaxID=3346117 RepID=UPI003625555D